MTTTMHHFFGVGPTSSKKIGSPHVDFGTVVQSAEKQEREEAEREIDEAFAAIRHKKPLYTFPEAVRANKKVVLAAIGNEGALCYNYIASQEMRERDRDVVLA